MFYLKHVHPSHSSGEYVLVQSIYSIFSVKSTMWHVTCYMWSVMCCKWLVTCKSFIIYWETGDQELCSWFFFKFPAFKPFFGRFLKIWISWNFQASLVENLSDGPRIVHGPFFYQILEFETWGAGIWEKKINLGPSTVLYVCSCSPLCLAHVLPTWLGEQAWSYFNTDHVWTSSAAQDSTSHTYYLLAYVNKFYLV